MNQIPDGEQERKKNLWSLDVRPSRIEALCDGVFAIAMTILVLELSMDHEILDAIALVGEANTGILFNAVYAYVMGFIVLGIYWAFHHYMFHFIKRSNGVLVWLNVLFLMFAALVPLATKVTRVHIESYPGFAFYMFTTVITFLLLLTIWQYATRGYRLVDRDINREIISSINNIIIIGSALALVVLFVTYFIPWFGYFGFVPLGYVIIAIAYGYHKPLS
jgi:uncharacterized membrane protein